MQSYSMKSSAMQSSKAIMINSATVRANSITTMQTPTISSTGKKFGFSDFMNAYMALRSHYKNPESDLQAEEQKRLLHIIEKNYAKSNFEVPSNIKLYHIVHVDNLESICRAGGLYSLASMQTLELDNRDIGNSKIKQRRLEKAVGFNHSLKVGECVPFNFCPRSVMLYAINRHALYGINQQEQQDGYHFRGGQQHVVHLEFDLAKVLEYCARQGKQWAFSNDNASANGANFFSHLKFLNQVNWPVINSNNWQGQSKPKQAEFLVQEFIDFSLVETIGVKSPHMLTQVQDILGKHAIPTEVKCLPQWYY